MSVCQIRLTFIIIIINISGILWEILQKSMVWFIRKNTKYLCNLEAQATVMLFHIKVSLFYPFVSQRLDFVKIILSDLVEI
jgi:hypothetical protein